MFNTKNNFIFWWSRLIINSCVFWNNGSSYTLFFWGYTQEKKWKSTWANPRAQLSELDWYLIGFCKKCHELKLKTVIVGFAHFYYNYVEQN